MSTVRTIIAISDAQNLFVYQMNVKNGFIHGDLKEEIHMKPPPDDINITGTDSSLITSLEQQFKDSFHMKDLGTLTHFLGLEVHNIALGVIINQYKYTQNMISLAGLQDSSSVDIPLEFNVKYLREEGDLLPDTTMFRQLVWSLYYLTITRPDISLQCTNGSPIRLNAFSDYELAGCPDTRR
nr:uncharacterized protein LOC109119446 [Solanum lycopersicum]